MTDELLKKMQEITLERKELFHGKIIDVAIDTVRLPNGATGKRELVFHPGGVGIVAINPEGKILLVKQFRKPTESILLEIPAGKIDSRDHGHAYETGLRELEEETGYTTPKMELVTASFLSPGFSDEKLWIYYTDQLEKVANPLPQDEDEVLEIYAYTLAEAKAAIATGLIEDAKTIIGIQHWELLSLRGSAHA